MGFFALSIDIHGLSCGICISSEVALSRTTFLPDPGSCPRSCAHR